MKKQSFLRGALVLSLGVNIPRSAAHSVVVFLITLVLTYFSIVFGELVPKRLAMKKTESLSLSLSGILFFMSKICAPLVWLLTVSTNALLRLLGIDPNQNDEVVTEDEIKMMLMEGSQQTALDILADYRFRRVEPLLILGDVIRELKEQGYRFGTLDELTASGHAAG